MNNQRWNIIEQQLEGINCKDHNSLGTKIFINRNVQDVKNLQVMCQDCAKNKFEKGYPRECFENYPEFLLQLLKDEDARLSENMSSLSPSQRFKTKHPTNWAFQNEIIQASYSNLVEFIDSLVQFLQRIKHLSNERYKQFNEILNKQNLYEILHGCFYQLQIAESDDESREAISSLAKFYDFFQGHFTYQSVFYQNLQKEEILNVNSFFELIFQNLQFSNQTFQQLEFQLREIPQKNHFLAPREKQIINESFQIQNFYEGHQELFRQFQDIEKKNLQLETDANNFQQLFEQKESEIADIISEKEQQVLNLIENHNQEIQDLMEEQQQQISNLMEEHQEQLDEIIQEKETLERLNESLNIKIEEINQLNELKQNELDQLMIQLNELNKRIQQLENFIVKQDERISQLEDQLQGALDRVKSTELLDLKKSQMLVADTQKVLDLLAESKVDERESIRQLKIMTQIPNFSESWTGCVQFLSTQYIAVIKGQKQKDYLVVYNLKQKCEHFVYDFNSNKHSYSLWTISQLNEKELVAGLYNKVYLFDFIKGEMLKEFGNQECMVAFSTVLAYSQQHILVAYNDAVMRLWDINGDGQMPVRRWMNQTKQRPFQLIKYEETQFIAGYSDQTIKIWEMDKDEPEQIIEQSDQVVSLSLINKHLLFIGLMDSSLQLMNLKTLEVLNNYYTMFTDIIKINPLSDSFVIISTGKGIQYVDFRETQAGDLIDGQSQGYSYSSDVLLFKGLIYLAYVDRSVDFIIKGWHFLK